MTRPPLNGTKTHPLSDHALRVLAALAQGGPVPAYQLNPGVRNRLDREALVEEFTAWSGRTNRAHVRITDAGLAALKASK